MDKEKLVAKIIENSEHWTEDDKDALSKLDEKVLEKMSKMSEVKPVENEGEAKPEEKPEDEEKPVENQASESTENEGEDVTVEQYIANAPEGMRDMLQAGLRAHEEQKAKQIKIITANKRNQFSDAQLKAMGLTELKSLAALAAEPEKKGGSVDYSGAGLDVEVSTQNKEEPMPLPTMNFGD